jgi:MFS transporter, DHA2 family, multidrug resistance protein
MFGSFVLLPLYAQTLMGYTAMWAGLVLGPGGLASLFIMPIGGALMKKGVRPRRLLALGLATMAYALWLMSGLNLGADFSAIAVPRFVQGFGLGLFFVPLAASTYVNITREEMGNASGIFNLLRNLGGSFGVAVATTLLSQRAQLHQTFLTERVTPYSPALREYGQHLQQLFPGQDPAAVKSPMALAAVYHEVLRQANMLAFNDVFYLFTWLTAILVPLTVFMRRAKGTPAPVPRLVPFIRKAWQSGRPAKILPATRVEARESSEDA